ncbi:rho GTPase-activating protein 19-like [Ornithodoros turicata]|uniref:rho GTPase-activating protein 19-like n=1 Tax=Ornithodoros turicata TaxID=34597 RepID=UPI00313899E0
MDCVTSEVTHSQRDEVTAFRFDDGSTFSVLCKMHLSFVLDLEKDEFSSILEMENAKSKRKRLPIYKKLKVSKDLANATILTAEAAQPIRHLIKHLQKSSNIKEEGLFRKSGSVSRQQALKILLTRNILLDFDEDGYSVHDCACTLKSLLSDLEEPLLTNAHFVAYCRIPGLYREKALPSIRVQCKQRQLKAAQLLLLLLPQPNYDVTKELLLLLHGVSNARLENCMSSESLATLFTPIILCPRQMPPDQMHINNVNITKPVAFLIENAPSLFDYPVELVKDVISYIKQSKKGSSPEDSTEDNTEPIKTTITFCVQRNTSAEKVEDYTEKALAELYDYVQGMPEVLQKKKYVRQFNKENTDGTAFKRRKHERSRTFGDCSKDLCAKSSFQQGNVLTKSSSVDKIQVPNAKINKEKVTSMLSSPWRFLKKKQDESSDSYDTPLQAKPETRRGTPLRNTVLRASRRVKNAMMTQKQRKAHDVLRE